MKLIDLTRQTFGRLTVIERTGTSCDRQPLWRARCECGNAVIVRGPHLRSGKIKSCGCFHLEQITTHRQTDQPIYRTWAMMLQRCRNPDYTHYHHYGGRGVCVCEAWLTFEGFYQDMGPTWRPGLTLDRIDVDGNYTPDNCRWATRAVQSRNRRKTGQFIGVHFAKDKGRWAAYITVDDRRRHLGYFDTPEDAARVRDAEARKHEGFPLNFPEVAA